MNALINMDLKMAKKKKKTVFFLAYKMNLINSLNGFLTNLDINFNKL